MRAYGSSSVSDITERREHKGGKQQSKTKQNNQEGNTYTWPRTMQMNASRSRGAYQTKKPFCQTQKMPKGPAS